MYTPTDDPLPWVTDRMRRSGALDREDREVWSDPRHTYISHEGPTQTAAAALLEVLTQTVSALHDDEKAYTVILNRDAASAGTLLERRIVEVGSKPWNDTTITEGQRSAVMAGLALHEVGHIRFARLYTASINRLFGKEHVTAAIRTLSNLAADCHDELAACRAFPGLAPAIPVTLWWCGGKGEVGTVASTLIDGTAPDRVNLAIAAARYPWQVEWDTPEAREWLDWWTDWADRAAQTGEPKDHALIVKEAIEKVREHRSPEAEEDEQQEQGPGTPTPSTTDPDAQPEGFSSGGRDMSDTEPGDEQGQGSAQGDEQGEDEPEAGSSGSEAPEAPSEPEGESKAEGSTDIDGNDRGEQPADVKADDDGSEAEAVKQGSEQGDTGTGASTGSAEEQPFDPDENDESRLNDPCTVAASKDERDDSRFQKLADKVNKGKREGMRRRSYRHSPASVYQTRVVVSVPRKGKRWVYDF